MAMGSQTAGLAAWLTALKDGEDVAATLKTDEVVAVSAGVVAALIFRREVKRPALPHPNLNVAKRLPEVARTLLDLSLSLIHI